MNSDHSKRIFGLDLMRAYAIISVVRGHGGLISQDLFSKWPSVPWADGVELFFVLSGFLIGGILIRDMERHPDYGLGRLMHFWKRRWFRTLPAYYLVLLLNILFMRLELNGDDPAYFSWKFFFFLQNNTEGVIGFFWESWSLTIEEWFYILIPLGLFVLNRFMSLRASLLTVIAVALVLPLLYRMCWAPDANDYFWWTTYYKKPLFARLDAIIYGVLGAYLYHYHKVVWKKVKWPALVLGLVLMFSSKIFNTTWDSWYGRVLYLSVIPLGALMLLPVLSTWKRCTVSWLQWPITYVSKISYSMYLINLGLVAQVMEQHCAPVSRMEIAQNYLLYWVIVLVCSGLLYRFFEKPMMDLRDRF